MKLEHVVDVFQDWLHLPDQGALLAMLGTVAANRLEGDPVWLLLVGPPGGGKSELLSSVSGLANMHPTATLTEASLLSGTPKKEHENGAKGGLLRNIGENGILVCKDFGSVLNMNRDARAAVLAALREIYDGSWTRHVGTGGGRTLAWAGRVGLIAGCTPTIDRHHTVMGAMGERFVLFRLPEVDAAEHARRALAHAGHESEMRRALSTAIAELFAGGLKEPPPLAESEREHLVAITTLVAHARSAVERDGYTREIELIPGSEAPTRLIVVLARLLGGLDAIGASRHRAWQVVNKAALDSIPAIRRAAMHTLHMLDEYLETSRVAESIAYPTSTTRRALEDLTAHGITDRVSLGPGKPDRWALTPAARDKYIAALAFPDLSANAFNNPHRVFDDISGMVK